MVLSTEWSQVEVIDLVNDGNGLGFILVGGRSTGVVIKALTPGGVAERDGRLQCGDHLLQIGEVNLRGFSSEQVATVLRQTGAQVRLIVARPVEPTGNDYQNLASHAPIIPTKLLSDPEELSRHLYQNSSFDISGAIVDVCVDAHENGSGVMTTDPSCFVSTPDTELADLPLPPLPAKLLLMENKKRPCPRDLDIVPFSLISPPPKSVSSTSKSLVLTLNQPPSETKLPIETPLPCTMDHIETVIVGHVADQNANHNDIEFDQCSDTSSNYIDSPETETYVVELHKNVYGLGITVAGYVCEEEDLSGIFVKSIIEGSAAETSGQIQINDRIVAVDGKSLAGVTNHQAVEILRNTDIEVHLTLERFLRGRKYEHLQVALTELKVDTQSQSSLPASPSIATLTWLPPKSDADSIATEGGGGAELLRNICDLPSRDTVESNMSIILDRSEHEAVSDINQQQQPQHQAQMTHTSSVVKCLTNGNISNLIGNGLHHATNEINSKSQTKSKPLNVQTALMVSDAIDKENEKLRKGSIVSTKSVNEKNVTTTTVALLTTTTIITTATTTARTTTTTAKTMKTMATAIKKSPVTSPSSESLKVAWKSEFPESEIYVAEINKLSGLGISLEGTVDVECGIEKRPHHFIRSILEDGPVGRQGILKPGDELLQVNDHKLQGLKHTEVVKILKELPTHVKLVCARGTKAPTIINTSQNPEAFDARSILPGGHQSLQNLLTKALSESSLYTSSTATLTDQQRSKSLENVSGLALWTSDVTTIEIEKTEQGFGFSILDYQDPLDSEGSVIVIRGLIRGGAAEATNDIFPGDRLVSVGEHNLQGLDLDEAVAILKGMPVGKTKLGICRPLSSSDSNIASPADGEDTPST